MIRITADRKVRGALLFVLPGVWIATVLALSRVLPGGMNLLPALAVAPAIACAGSGRRVCVLLSGLVAVGCLSAGLVRHQGEGRGIRLGTAVAVFAVQAACLRMAGHRALLTAELERIRDIAVAAQQVLLRPLPERLGDYEVAAEYLSASAGARVGGDLYEVLITPFGLRAIVGDVRGHGMSAIGTVAALLGSFREAAHDEPELVGVLRRLDRTMSRHLREREHMAGLCLLTDAGATPLTGRHDEVIEEFATLLLLQLSDEGGVQLVNCGHPQPYLLRIRQCPQLLPMGDPLPPLGVLDAALQVVPVQRAALRPGEGLVVHTDGLPEARDAAGAFFPLPDVMAAMVPAARSGGARRAGDLAGALMSAALEHAGGRLADDMAVLVLLRETPAVSSLGHAAELSASPGR